MIPIFLAFFVAVITVQTVVATVVNIHGTSWANASDPGGCQMPEGNYTVQHALALGQSPYLGPLVWRQGLCGQVLRVDCGGSPVEAVVTSVCNLGSDICGVDLVRSTWNQATGNRPPSVAQCRVELTNTNPMTGAGPLCYFRPNGHSQEYYASLGVLNTGGRIVTRALAAGMNGVFQSGSGWLDFNAQGNRSFTPGAQIEFFFEDGTSSSFKLSECRNVNSVHIWN